MMRSTSILCCLTALLACSTGCVAQRPPATLDTVGPMHQVNVFHKQQGSLTVYTALINNPNDPEHQWHSAYRIYSGDGALLRTVTNQSGSFNQEPEAINLSVGHYTITADAVNYGDVNVPVEIAEGKTTVVDLNQEVLSESPPIDHSWVRLPNGHVVGEKATP